MDKPKQGRRYSDNLKANALSMFHRELDQGLRAKAASEAVGVPLATLYRWKQKPEILNQLTSDLEAMSRIDRAIAVLVGGEGTRPFGCEQFSKLPFG